MHFLLGFNIAAVCLKIFQNYNEIPTRANFQPKNGKKESSRSMKSGSPSICKSESVVDVDLDDAGAAAEDIDSGLKQLHVAS